MPIKLGAAAFPGAAPAGDDPDSEELEPFPPVAGDGVPSAAGAEALEGAPGAARECKEPKMF